MRGLEPAMFGRDRYGTHVPSEQEWRVMKFVAQGLKNTEIAEAMGATRYVIANYLRSMYDQLGSGIALNWPPGTRHASTARKR